MVGKIMQIISGIMFIVILAIGFTPFRVMVSRLRGINWQPSGGWGSTQFNGLDMLVSVSIYIGSILLCLILFALGEIIAKQSKK